MSGTYYQELPSEIATAIFCGDIPISAAAKKVYRLPVTCHPRIQNFLSQKSNSCFILSFTGNYKLKKKKKEEEEKS